MGTILELWGYECEELILMDRKFYFLPLLFLNQKMIYPFDEFY